MVAMAQAMGQYVSLVIEYGFGFSATRVVARRRDDLLFVSETLTAVLTAKTLLSLGAIAVVTGSTVLFFPSAPTRFLLAGLAYGVAQGINVVWIYQALDRTREIAIIEVCGKVGGACLLFAIVHTPSQAWLVPLLSGVGAALATAVGLARLLSVIPISRPSIGSGLVMLREGWSTFLFRASESLWWAGNPLILGYFSGATQVGIYTAAERICRAAIGLLGPATQALYPEINALLVTDQRGANILARKALVTCTVLAALAAAGLMLFARTIVSSLLGPTFLSSAPVLQILSLLLPLVAIENIVAFQYFLPRALDTLLAKLVSVAAAVNAVVATVAAPSLGAKGMAIAVLISTLLLTTLVCARLFDRPRRSHL
ncbi:MAG: oligosaccharide flippase family protein [Acidobacteria bacterium]|nr:oligosaccharide flippase family protein [Acidobacteriota bacterium]